MQAAVIPVICKRARLMLNRMGDVQCAQIIKKDGGKFDVEGVLLRPHSEPITGGMMVTRAAAVQFQTMAKDVEGVNRGDGLLLGDKRYSVVMPRVDERGVFCSLQLKEEAAHA